jgi:hypothetical protein
MNVAHQIGYQGRKKTMKKAEVSGMKRREFLAYSPMLLLGARFLNASPLSQATPRGVDLLEELTPAEVEIVNSSTMASNLESFFDKGYSCAESGLAVALHYLNKPDDLVWVAGGFGGGLYSQDLCGFLTAGAMAIGLYSGTLKMDRKAAKRLCVQKVRQYWKWWTSVAPLHCAEIREGRRDFKVCYRLGKLSAAKVEGLTKPATTI